MQGVVVRRGLVVLTMLANLTIYAAQQATAEKHQVPKKVIYCGWGMPDTQYLRDAWRRQEVIPFDGTGVVVAIDRAAWARGDRGPSNQLAWNAMGSRRYTYDEFSQAVEDLVALRRQPSFHAFLPVALSASAAATVSWFDDARWRSVAGNLGVMAQIATKTGMKGFVFDPEHYGYELFSYRFQRTRDDRSFDEYEAMARQRGREVMKAIAAHSPNVVVISLYSYTLPLNELRRGGTLASVDYGLMPAFYDGLLEEMPDGGTLVDGYEFAYGFKEERRFREGRQRIRAEAVTLSSVPDRYRRRVRAAFGLWVDYGGKPQHLSPPEFQRSVRAALDKSDAYVWIYSHHIGFFPLSPDASPYIEAITVARAAYTRP
jgi:hypothetical protein